MLEKAWSKAHETRAQVVVFRSDQYREDLQEFVQVRWTLHEKELPPYRPMYFRNFTGNIFKVFVGWAWDKLFSREYVEENHFRFQQLRTSNDMLFVFSAIAFATNSGRGACTPEKKQSKVIVQYQREVMAVLPRGSCGTQGGA